MIRIDYNFFLYLTYLGAMALETQNPRLMEVFREDLVFYKNAVSAETISHYKSKFLNEEMEYLIKSDSCKFLKEGFIKLFKSGYFDEVNLKRWLIW